jgi:uncharacterized protein
VTLDEIAQKLIDEKMTPGQLSEVRMKLSATYSFIATRLDEILMVKPQEWLKIREQSTSDNQADRKWELTENGRLEKVYRQQLKTCEKMMSAIKTRIEVMTGEAKNQY